MFIGTKLRVEEGCFRKVRTQIGGSFGKSFFFGCATGMVRHNVTITLIDDEGGTGPSWQLINAWPVGYTVPDLNGMGGEVAIQSLELCHEGLEHIPGSAAGAPSDI